MSMRKATVRTVLAAEAASLVASPTWLAAAVVVPFLSGPALRLATDAGLLPRGADRGGLVLFSLVLSAFLGAVAAAWEGIGRPRAEGEWEARLVLPIGRRRLRLALLAGAILSALVACGSALASLAMSGTRIAAGDLLLIPVLAVASGACAQAVALGGRGLGTLVVLAAGGAVTLSRPTPAEVVRPWLIPGAAAFAVVACAAALGRREVPTGGRPEAAPPPAYRPPGHTGPRPVHGAAFLAIVALLGFVGGVLVPKDPLRQVLVFQVGIILFPALLLATVTNQPYREAFRAGWPGGARLLGAPVAALCLLLLMKEAMLLPLFRMPEGEAQKIVDVVDGCASHGRFVALLVLALLPALCEDLAFRGYLLSSLSRAWGPSTAVLASAVPFALLHGASPRGAIMLVLGVVYGTLVDRWGSIWVGVLAHLTHNGLVLFPRLWPDLLRTSWLDEGAHVPPELLAASALVLGLLLWLPKRPAPA